MTARDYYCSMKFRHLKIDLESQVTYTCHAAKPHRIDFQWLVDHPGQLFNHDINVQERKMMLMNQRTDSCEQNCWPAEDHGQISPRLYQNGAPRTHKEVFTKPEEIDMTLGSDCNLTCSYCCKEFSSAWRQDLMQHGNYESHHGAERYEITNKDRILAKVSQPSLLASSNFNRLLDEINLVSDSLNRLIVTGGEPFLNNKLVHLINGLDLPDDAVIQIYTGLGVDPARFSKILDLLKSNQKITIRVSSEGIGPWLEFNRYGITWPRFEQNLKSIIDRGFNFDFQSQISNLTVFGFREFYEYYQTFPIVMTFVYQPRMQALHILDDVSKTKLQDDFSFLPARYRIPLQQTICPEANDIDRQDLSKFLSRFVSVRPDLDINLYPKSFLSWLGI